MILGKRLWHASCILFIPFIFLVLNVSAQLISLRWQFLHESPESTYYILANLALVIIFFVGYIYARRFKIQIQWSPKKWTLNYVFLSLAIGTSAGIFFGIFPEFSGVNFYLLILLINTAIVEEYMFRGVMLKSLSVAIGTYWTMILQALIFAILHGRLDAIYLIGYFIFAIAVGGLVAEEKRGGLWLAIIAHATANILDYIFMAGHIF